MRVIEYPELNDRLLAAIDIAGGRDYNAYRLFWLMYETGCRYVDTTTFNSWVFDDINQQLLILSPKTNTWRYCPFFTLSNEFIAAYRSETFVGMAIRYDTARRRFTDTLRPNRFYLTNKAIDLHIFRHNYAKKLQTNGYPIEEIALFMGITKLEVAQGYAYDPLYIIE